MINTRVFSLLLVMLILSNSKPELDRGYISCYKQKYMWSRTQEAFVPNYVMIDVIANQRDGGNSNDLSLITEEDMDAFIKQIYHRTRI